VSYEIDDDRGRVDFGAVWGFLSEQAYWGRWRSRSDVEQQIVGAWRVVGCYRSSTGAMVGFARAVSDGVAVAYLADVFVLAQHRGKGLGKRLVETMIEAGPGRDFRWLLHTADAHGLYEQFGFALPDDTLLDRPSRQGPPPAGAVAPCRPSPPP
jgi:GNAT superfamily N-acetyltransferase